MWQVKDIVECQMMSEKTAKECCTFLLGSVVAGREMVDGETSGAGLRC